MSPEQLRKPLSPSEIEKLRVESIPEEVFVVFNSLIAKNLSGNRSVIKQREVVTRLGQIGIESSKAYENHWLDVEPSYREAGWTVKYDKPGWNESYDAYFEFSRPANNR